MTDIRTIQFTPEIIKALNGADHTKDWPVVYLLEDGSELYVGETINAANRFKQHYEKPERQKLKRAHLIIDEEYNKSATLDTESQLIQYMVADAKFSLQNSNKGLLDHSYFDREKYRAKFEVIWTQLQELGLASSDLVQLRNSAIFKYSPYKALTEEQIQVVKEISTSIIAGYHGAHIVNGEPGTGKSVLASYLVKYLKESPETKDMSVALVVSMTSLRQTLKRVFSKINGLSASMVMGPNEVKGKQFDILIIDEAHRLRRRVNLANYGTHDDTNKFYGLGKEGTQLDWILRASKSQIFLYDANQSVMPSDIRPEQFERLNAVHHHLTSQLRVQAGEDYINFINNLLASESKPKPDFGDYDLRYFTSASEMIKEIKKRNTEQGLARVVAGYAWDWKTKTASQDYDIEIDGLHLKWNGTNVDWVNSPNAINEVGCIHTIQGYDLNYIGVIIGPELSYDPTKGELTIDSKKYKDFNGSRSIQSHEELKAYIVNIYKTLLTRGIHGTYIHAVDNNLEKYIRETFK